MHNICMQTRLDAVATVADKALRGPMALSTMLSTCMTALLMLDSLSQVKAVRMHRRMACTHFAIVPAYMPSCRNATALQITETGQESH